MDAAARQAIGGEDGMIACVVTTGFFVLGRCNRPAVTGCGGCGRPICAHHVAPDGLCVECAAARGYPATDPYPPAWTRGYRRTYYEYSAREYRDTLWYSRFDDYDRGAFDPDDAYDPDFGVSDGSDFVDS
jgi:hypothetical protein